MDYALFMGCRYTFCSLEAYAYGLLVGEASLSGYIILEGYALYQLHYYIMELSLIHGIIGCHYVGMSQVRCGSGLIVEFAQKLLILRAFLPEHLYGYDTVQLRVLCLIHIGHPTLTYLIQYLIASIKYITGLNHPLHRLPYT